MLEAIAIYLSWGMLILSIGGLMIKPAWQRLGFASKQDMIDHGRIYDEQRKRN